MHVSMHVDSRLSSVWKSNVSRDLFFSLDDERVGSDYFSSQPIWPLYSLECIVLFLLAIQLVFIQLVSATIDMVEFVNSFPIT